MLGRRVTASFALSVAATWLSSTARRSALNSSPGRATLPCTPRNWAGVPSVGIGTARPATPSARAVTTGPTTDPATGLTASPPNGIAGGGSGGPVSRRQLYRARHTEREQATAQGDDEGHERRPADGDESTERRVGLAERELDPREPAVGQPGSQALGDHPGEREGQRSDAVSAASAQPAVDPAEQPEEQGLQRREGEPVAAPRHRCPTRRGSARRRPDRRRDPARNRPALPVPVSDQASRARESGAATQTSTVGKARHSAPRAGQGRHDARDGAGGRAHRLTVCPHPRPSRGQFVLPLSHP